MSALRLGPLRVYSTRVQTSMSRRFSVSSRHQRRTNLKSDEASKPGQDGLGQGTGRARQGLLWAGELAWLASVAHCLKEYALEPCTVHGPSMQPTIEDKSWLLMDKTRSWRTAPLETTQVVMVRSPLEPGKMLVKRIAGLPGDTIKVRPPAWYKHNSSGIKRRLEVVPEGHVWLEGDNKDNSTDSRMFGSVPQGLVEGVVCFRLWPPTGFGVFE